MRLSRRQVSRQLAEDLAGRFEKGKQLYPKVPPNVRGVLWRNSRNGKYFIWLMREWQRAALEAKSLTVDEESNLAYSLIDFVEGWDKRKFPRDIYQLSFAQARQVFRLRRRTRPVPLTGEGTKLVLDTDDFALVRYETREAACFYGRGTKWCISGRETADWWFNYRRDRWRVYLILSKTLPSDHPFYKVTLLLRWKTHEPPVIEGDWIRADNKKTSRDEMAISGFTREDVERINLEATRDFRGLTPPDDVEVFLVFEVLRERVRRAKQETPERFQERMEELAPMRAAFLIAFSRAVETLPLEPLYSGFRILLESETFAVLVNADVRLWDIVLRHMPLTVAAVRNYGVNFYVSALDEFFLFTFSRRAFSWRWQLLAEHGDIPDWIAKYISQLRVRLPYLFDGPVNSRFRRAESSFPQDAVLYRTAARLQLVLFALHGYFFDKDLRRKAMDARFLEPSSMYPGVVERRLEASIEDAKLQVEKRRRGRHLLTDREEEEFLTPEQMSWFVHRGSVIIEDADMETEKIRKTLKWLRAHVPKPQEVDIWSP